MWCQLCKGQVDPRDKNWSATIRVLYRAQDGYRISGVGVYQYRYIHPSVDVPLDEQKLYHDQHVEWLVFSLRSFQYGDNFILHNACWNILKAYFPSAPIPLDMVVDTLKLHPKEMITAIGNLYPSKDPSQPLVVQDLLRATKGLRKPRKSVVQQRMKPHFDTFTTLPLELREEIAVYLRTADLCRSRLVSRSMEPIFFSQRFWATRFEIDGDRGFLASIKDTQNVEQGKIDWQFLYHCTNSLNLVKRLHYRKLIWDLCRWVRDMSVRITPSSPPELCREHLDSSCWDWKDVHGQYRTDEELPYPMFPRYVQVLLKKAVYIPESLNMIAVSISREFDVTHVTGLEFLSDDHQPIRLGYIIPGSRMIHGTKHLVGFEVAVSETGIHALRIITKNNSTSLWIGETQSASITDRLILNQKVDALEVGFDKYKMVSVAVGSQKTGPPQQSLSLSLSSSSWMNYNLQNALWYPDKPPKGICFNEESFSGGDPLIPGYRPIVWTLFGGEDGSCLSSLTKISISVVQDQFYRMSFFYNNEERFPRCSLDLSNFPNMYQESAHTRHFSIDGPGGERISTLQVAIEKKPNKESARYINGDVPLSYKISTDYGQQVWTRDETCPLPKTCPLQKCEITPGTTPVGFYAVKQYELGIISLGVISKAL